MERARRVRSADVPLIPATGRLQSFRLTGITVEILSTTQGSSIMWRILAGIAKTDKTRIFREKIVPITVSGDLAT